MHRNGIYQRTITVKDNRFYVHEITSAKKIGPPIAMIGGPDHLTKLTAGPID
jgi:hypothetical protein